MMRRDRVVAKLLDVLPVCLSGDLIDHLTSFLSAPRPRVSGSCHRATPSRGQSFADNVLFSMASTSPTALG
jgi:hypothetical protein